MGFAIEMAKHKEALDNEGTIFLKNIRHAKLLKAFLENYFNVIRPAMLRFDKLKLTELPYFSSHHQTLQ